MEKIWLQNILDTLTNKNMLNTLTHQNILDTLTYKDILDTLTYNKKILFFLDRLVQTSCSHLLVDTELI